MKLLTTQQAAARIGLRPAIMRRYCQQGRLHAYKIGRDWMIPTDALDKFASLPRKVGRPRGKKRKPSC